MTYMRDNRDVKIERLQRELAAVTAERDGLRDELSRLADAGTGYSQQTMDAIVKERDRLKALMGELRAELMGCVSLGRVTERARSLVSAYNKTKEEELVE